jgi:hypothetical protein
MKTCIFFEVLPYRISRSYVESSYLQSVHCYGVDIGGDRELVSRLQLHYVYAELHEDREVTDVPIQIWELAHAQLETFAKAARASL